MLVHEAPSSRTPVRAGELPYLDLHTSMGCSRTSCDGVHSLIPTTNLDRALMLARAGFRVVPQDTNVGGEDYSPKRPHPELGAGWQHKATTDEAQIIRWWTMWPEANIGARPPLDVVVLDIDVKPGQHGAQALKDWVAVHGELPVTPTVLTATGGMHLYFRADSIDELKAAPLKDLDGRKLCWDIRHGGLKGGQVIMPGTSTDDGEYRWVIAPEGFRSITASVSAAYAPLPEKLRALIPVKSPHEAHQGRAKLLKVALPTEAREVLRTGAGGCNDPSRDVWNSVTALRNEGLEYFQIADLLHSESDCAYAHRHLNKRRQLSTAISGLMRAHEDWYIPLTHTGQVIAAAVTDVVEHAAAARQMGLMKGVHGTTDTLVLAELTRIAAGCNQLDLFCSLRTLSAALHLHRDTVAASLGRLKEMHWVRLVGLAGQPTEKGGIGARTYRLQVPNAVREQVYQHSATTSYSQMNSGGTVLHLRRKAGDFTEAFARGALGPSAQLVFEVLLAGAAQPKDLVTKLSISRMTASRALSSLKALGIADSDGGRWSLQVSQEKAEAELLAYSKRFGVARSLQARRKAMQNEQAGWAAMGGITGKLAQIETAEAEDQLLLEAVCAEHSVSESDARVIKGRAYLRLLGDSWVNLGTGQESAGDPALRGLKKKEEEATVGERRSQREA